MYLHELSASKAHLFADLRWVKLYQVHSIYTTRTIQNGTRKATISTDISPPRGR